MSKIYVTEQASKNNGKMIVTEFSDGSACIHYSNGRKSYHTAPNARGLVRSIHHDTAPKKCALMDELAAKGVC